MEFLSFFFFWQNIKIKIFPWEERIIRSIILKKFSIFVVDVDTECYLMNSSQ